MTFFCVTQVYKYILKPLYYIGGIYYIQGSQSQNKLICGEKKWSDFI